MRLRIHRQPDLDPLLLRRRSEHGHQLLRRLRRIEGNRFEGQLPRLDLREVEKVVQQTQHPLAGAAHHLQLGLLLGVEIAQLQRLDHAHHAVHRRADLVADVGQELVLHRIGRLGRGAGLGQLPVQPAKAEQGRQDRHDGDRPRRCQHRLQLDDPLLLSIRALQGLHVVAKVVGQLDDGGTVVLGVRLAPGAPVGLKEIHALRDLAVMRHQSCDQSHVISVVALVTWASAISLTRFQLRLGLFEPPKACERDPLPDFHLKRTESAIGLTQCATADTAQNFERRSKRICCSRAIGHADRESGAPWQARFYGLQLSQ